MCHHRGYEYLREREELREESLDGETDERREPVQSIDPEDADARDGEDERTEEPEPAVADD